MRLDFSQIQAKEAVQEGFAVRLPKNLVYKFSGLYGIYGEREAPYGYGKTPEEALSDLFQKMEKMGGLVLEKIQTVQQQKAGFPTSDPYIKVLEKKTIYPTLAK